MIDGIFDQPMNSLEKGITRASKTHEIISHNIANANTPEFVPGKFDEVLEQAVTRRTQPGVNLEEEMADLAKNSANYSAYVKLLTSKMSVLRTVISQGRK